MKKPLAIGIDDFRRVREEDYYYIDKSLMIKDFIEYKKYVTLITRPRRFGKSLNMSMLRDFFDITKDSKEIFRGLAIMDTEVKGQMNSLPVIYLTFKNCSGNTCEELKESLAKAMREEYVRYAELFASDVGRKEDNYYFFYQTYEKLKAGTIGDISLGGSLSELMRAVSLHYNQRVIVLIDEYDHPLIKAYDKGFRDEFSTVYGSFLGEALNGNQYLEQALVTGIQRVVKESIFSELNNFVVYTVLSKQYSQYFGLTEEETSQALESFGEELQEDIRLYYDGYVFAGLNMYNPWSILNYIDSGELKPYWINTSTNVLIRESIRGAQRDFVIAFEKLIMDGEIEVSVNLETSFIELATSNSLWGLLVNSGYLTAIRSQGEEVTLRIPNVEVKREFRSIVAAYTHLTGDTLNQLFNSLITNRMDNFLIIYQKLIDEYVSMYDVKENSYHMLLLGMAISVSGMYKISSNMEAGDGRPDILLESLQPQTRPHVIFELKQGDNIGKLKEEALGQILKKRYYAKLVGRVLCVGIAHNKKQCELIYKEIENN